MSTYISKKPSNIIYGLDEKPPVSTSILLGFQHTTLMMAALVFSAALISQFSTDQESAQYLIKMILLTMGIATMLQTFQRFKIGSGYLCPIMSGPAYLSALSAAGKLGGPALICGMMFSVGFFELLLAKVIPRVRSLFPPEVVGLLVTAVGLEAVTLAMAKFLGYAGPGGIYDGRVLVVAIATLGSMIIPSIWGKGVFRLYAMLIGCIVGYITAFITGIMPEMNELSSLQWLSFPEIAKYGWAFDSHLLIPFLIAALSSVLKAVGDFTTCQKINDADWKRSDMTSISRGLTAIGIGNLVVGAIGGLGLSTSSSNIGLSVVSGVTSRILNITIGAFLISLAFFPKIVALFVSMPAPIMGAIMLYSACFMIVAGLQILCSRMLDARKTFIIGISLSAGLSVDMIPGLFSNYPEWITPFVSSGLTLTTVLALLLNLVFRLGTEKTKEYVIKSDGSMNPTDEIFSFFNKLGGTWGARPEIIQKATYAVSELYETITTLHLNESPVNLRLSFDEFNLDINIQYRGKNVNKSFKQPTSEELLKDDSALANLSLFLIDRTVDKLQIDEKGENCHIKLHFEH